MIDTPIQPGDVFVRQYGDKELVHVILPESEWSAKIPYLRLHGISIDSTWNRTREGYGGHKKKWHYVGTVPAYWLDYLWRNWSLR